MLHLLQDRIQVHFILSLKN